MKTYTQLFRISFGYGLISLLLLSNIGCNNTKATEKTKTKNASNTPPIVKIPSDFYLCIERTPCYGTCPSFKVEVDAKANVKYYGKRFIPLLGNYTKVLPEEVFQKIVSRLQGAQLFKYQDKYDEPGISDLPSCILTYKAGGKQKVISMRAKFPDELNSLTTEIEKLIGTEDYTKVE